MKMHPVSSGTYYYKEYTIFTSEGGGKAGKNRNRTASLQATLPVECGVGYYVKKYFSFKVGNTASFDKAQAKLLKWIDEHSIVSQILELPQAEIIINDMMEELKAKKP